ncbi:hypothetical protein OGAPHI_004807 [Ogataea philodendri]|uniref:Origin recognition complex subunit 4 n=1 Tax=Ogataea philodendri TaxID=1378263 RepID=A0A9P8P213_9ASCO|nr:uncharacterized protein OGAPHI_004807 [Ogataea philodendri]KAH3664093.1 hypothetical protein OGAPHI_004807 [Ogataea philodendri]
MSKVSLANLEMEYMQIYKMLENTIKFNEGKSCLVIGPRGTGKTSLVNNALLELGEKFRNMFYVIRISGVYQNDDKSAIKEIARQLDWHLLRHSDQPNASFEKFSANETMNSVMSVLDGSRLEEDKDQDDEHEETQMPIIFVIDELEKYTNDAKQTLLYNLFDVAQSSSKSHAVAVLGLTTVTGVREQLEKRVKSRFSQKVIQLTKVKQLSEFCDMVLCLLKVSLDGLDESTARWAATYNEHIEKQVQGPSELRKLVVHNFYTTKDLNMLKNQLAAYLVQQDLTSLGGGSFPKLDTNNRSFQVLASLSEMELRLVICAGRQLLKNSMDQVNFNIAYEEFDKMTKSQTNTLNSQLQTMGRVKLDLATHSKDILLRCWERLIMFGLLVEPIRQINGINSSFYTGGESNKMFYLDVTLDEVAKLFRQTEWVAKWCRL